MRGIFVLYPCTWEIIFKYLNSKDICSLKETCSYIRELVDNSNVTSKKLNYIMCRLLLCRNREIVETAAPKIKTLTIHTLSRRHNLNKMFYTLRNMPLRVTTLKIHAHLKRSDLKLILYRVRQTLINLVITPKYKNVYDRYDIKNQFVLHKLKRLKITSWKPYQAMYFLTSVLPDTLKSIKYLRVVPLKTYEDTGPLLWVLSKQTRLENLTINNILGPKERAYIVKSNPFLKYTIIPYKGHLNLMIRSLLSTR